jgi:hypothetical protein
VANEAFTAIKSLLVPYAKHFKVWQDTSDVYDLQEDFTHSRTLFGYVYTSRAGARLGFYPLNVFPELHAGLPASIASKIKSKWVLDFKTVTAAEKKALAKLFAAGWDCIVAKRKLLGPDRGFYRKIRADETFAIVTKLLGDRATIVRNKSDVTIALPVGTKVPALLAAKQLKSGALKLKTITPAEYDALAALFTKPKSRRA